MKVSIPLEGKVPHTSSGGPDLRSPTLGDEAKGGSLGEERNAAGAAFRGNPKGRGIIWDAARRCSSLVWNDQTALLAPCAASQITPVALMC